MAFVSDGSQYEVGNFQVAFHAGDNVEAIIEYTLDNIKKSYEDYNQYQIVSLQHRGGNNSKRILVQEPTMEPFENTKLAEKIANHLEGAFQINLAPVVFEIRLFVSYNEPKL